MHETNKHKFHALFLKKISNVSVAKEKEVKKVKSETMNNQRNYDEYNLIKISSKPLPIGKVLISWVAMLIVFFSATQFFIGTISYFILTFGMLMVLGFQYGFSAVRQLFGPIKKGTKHWIFIYLILCFAFSIAIDFLFKPTASEHVSLEGISKMPLLKFLLDMGLMTFSLIGEEVCVAILSFPIFGWLYQLPKIRRYAFFISGIVSSVVFGISHLPVYEGNWFQCIFLIGLPRIFYNYAWRKSDSMWAGVWAHTLNNLLPYSIVYFGFLH